MWDLEGDECVRTGDRAGLTPEIHGDIVKTRERCPAGPKLFLSQFSMQATTFQVT